MKNVLHYANRTHHLSAAGSGVRIHDIQKASSPFFISWAHGGGGERTFVVEELLDPFYFREQFFRLGTYHIPTGVDCECESLVALSS